MRLFSPGHGMCGEHVNHATCGAGHHAHCDGFSGGYDTWQCGCCCHDAERDRVLSDEDRTIIGRVRGAAS